MYIFGYGSLIWRPDFAFASKCIGVVQGVERRFWQASHDHRGTEQLPGRVVTLVPASAGICAGMLYRLKTDVADTLSALDEREQDGYRRTEVQVSLCDGTLQTAITWIADHKNPSWRGGESAQQVSQIIAHRSGPSGSNREYLFKLHQALTQLNIIDPHVAELVSLVEKQVAD